MNEARSSDPVDPLQGYADLAVFYPTRYKVSPDTSKPFDLEAVDTQLKAMVLQHSPSTLDLAKYILSGTVEFRNSGIPQALKEKDEAVPKNAEENPQQRRPGLGRKRARFSMKPSTSQPAISLLPPLDIKNLKDPGEFFKAYERHDNAQREIKKQMGGASWDSDQHNPPPIKQSRRPQLFERTVKYKHLYPSLNHETSENLTSSQETSKTSILSPLNCSSQTESNDNVLLEEVDLAGSIAKEDNNLKEILDSLLSQNTEDLEGNGAISLLQECLKIKPIELEELCLPESQDIPKFDFNSSRRTLPKPTNVLTDIGNLMKGTSRTPAKRRKGEDGSIHLPSPTQPKSPFASLSALKKRILQSTLSGDPFSADDIDLLPATNPSAENGNKQSDLFEMGEEMIVSDELKLPSNEQNNHIEVAKTGSPEVDMEEISHIFDISGSEDASKLGTDIDVGSSKYHVDMEGNTGGSNMDNRVMDYTLSSPHADTDTCEIGANNGDKVEDKLEETVATAEPELDVANSTLEKLKGTQNELDQLHSAAVEEHATDGVSRNPDTGLETNNKIMQEDSGGSLNKQIKANSHPCREQESKKVSERKSLTATVEEHQMDDLFRNVDTGPETHNEIMQEDPGVSLNKQIKANSRPGRKQKRKEVSKRQSLAATEEHQTNGLSRNLDAGPETHNEEMQEDSQVSLNEQIKENSRPRGKQKSKEFSRRHSLAGAGTMWQSGVRRSTRIKTRPLKYWKGERLLYGRVHDTMATVIGIKYASPGKGDEAPLKVKSFVSDEYKELVELAALH